MYLLGAGLGVGFAALMYFALPRLDTVERAKKNKLKQLQRADLSAYTGAVNVSMDEFGVHICLPGRELRLGWQAVIPSAAAGFILLRHDGGGATAIPPRAFASIADAAAFLEHAQRWWQAGRRPHAERLARYLADRDRPCPRCKYNLRGMHGEVCPECGESIRLEALVAS